MKTFGYVRVSTREQNPKRQIDELKKYVSDERDIIVDRITGKVGDRPGLDLLKRLLRPGDELYVHELDRLGRNKKIIKDQLLYFREKEIETSFGESLSWEYLSYVRKNTIHWDIPTNILFADNDNMTSVDTMTNFANKINAKLTTMRDGEHWFHTDEQMNFLDKWFKENI